MIALCTHVMYMYVQLFMNLGWPVLKLKRSCSMTIARVCVLEGRGNFTGRESRLL